MRPAKNTGIKKLLVIAGPTSVGKSKIAVEVAKRHNGEIISADSMQIYKGMDVGTAKITPLEQEGIHHHLIDIVDIKKPFSVFDYQKLAREAIEKINEKGKIPVIVGGTGLYIRAAIDDFKFPAGKLENSTRKELEEELEQKGIEFLFDELKRNDPRSAETMDKNNFRRVLRALEVYRITGKPFSEFRQSIDNWTPLYPAIIVVLQLPREILYERINKRVDEMIINGLLEETQTLIKKSIKDVIVAKQAIGYKELVDYIDGKVSFDDAVENIKKRSRNYAKRQITWFKKDPRAVWIDASDKKSTINEIENILTTTG